MNLNPATVWFIAAVFAVGGVFDVWLLLNKGNQATISVTLYKLAQAWPVIPLLIGLLAGHLFASQCGIPCK